MGTTLPFHTQLRTGVGEDDYLVALVGLPRALASNAKGILTRCQLTPLELPSLVDACRVMTTIAPDAIVLDCHHPELKRLTANARLLMRTVDGFRRTDPALPLIMLSSAGLLKDLRREFLRVGVVELSHARQTYRQLAALIRRHCGLTDGCCQA